MRTGLVLWALLGGLSLLRPPAAGAHAFLDHAEPRVGSTVTSPSAVTLFFTEPIEPAFSHLEVLDREGKRVTTEPPTHPRPDQLQMALPALASGEYTVHWAVVSVDTHPTEGSFTFSVKAAR
jgi:copper resistance protein C